MASSAEDIAGTWQTAVTSAEIQFNEDGTWGIEFSGDHVHGPDEFRFEGTRLILIELRTTGDCFNAGAPNSIYEVELLENGNLKFTTIEDDCPTRVTLFVGALIEREWETVP